VAKNDDFLALSRSLAQLVATADPADVAALSALTLDGQTVEQVRTALVGKIGENLSIRRFTRIAAQGRLTSYVHGGSKIGVMLDLVGGDEQMAKDLAMHVAANKPKALSKEGVPAVDVERERSIATQKAAESGKPAEIVAKMVEGSVQKYLKEVTLLGQPFVKDDKVTVEQLLKSRRDAVATLHPVCGGRGHREEGHRFRRRGRRPGCRSGALTGHNRGTFLRSRSAPSTHDACLSTRTAEAFR
jgi:elongation factor Ts